MQIFQFYLKNIKNIKKFPNISVFSFSQTQLAVKKREERLLSKEATGDKERITINI